MLRRLNEYIGLDKKYAGATLLDRAPYSEFFNISEMPATFTSGKNYFKIHGNRELLELGSEIFIEILDSNRKPVYHTVNRYKDPSGNRIISVFIYEDTAPGPATINVIGKPIRDDRGIPIQQRVEENIQRLRSIGRTDEELEQYRREQLGLEGTRYFESDIIKPSVRWAHKINIEPRRPNISPTIFQVAPSIQIQEVNRKYQTYDYKVGDRAFTTSTEGSIISSKVYNYQQESVILKFENHLTDYGGFNPSQQSMKLSVNNITVAQIEDQLKEIAAANGFGKWHERSVDEIVDIVILDPREWVKKGMKGFHQYGYAWRKPLEGNILPPWTPNILEVKNGNELLVEAYQVYFEFKFAGTDGVGTDQIGRSISPIPIDILHKYTSHDNFTLTFQEAGSPKGDDKNIHSFARVTMKDIKPISGEVSRIKTYVKSAGLGPFKLLGDEPLVDQNLLTDDTSELPYQGAGTFGSQTAVDNLWTVDSASSYHGFANPDLYQDATAEYSNFPILGAAAVSGTYNHDSYFAAQKWYEDRPWTREGWTFRPNKSIDVYAGNEYSITFEAAAEKLPGQENPSRMELWISGSNVDIDDSVVKMSYIDPTIPEKLGNIRCAVIQAELDNANMDSLNILSDNLTDEAMSKARNAGYGSKGRFSNMAGRLKFVENQRKASSFIPGYPSNEYNMVLQSGFTPNQQQVVPGIVKKKLINFSYTPSRDGNINLIFNILDGKWFIGDVQVRGDRETGYTPSHTYFEFPIPTAQRDDILDFKFEFYNNIGLQSNVSLIVNNIDFSGSNLFIDGLDNVLQGTINIGDGFVMEGFDGTV